jgi:hypothetical protein
MARTKQTPKLKSRSKSSGKGSSNKMPPLRKKTAPPSSAASPPRSNRASPDPPRQSPRLAVRAQPKVTVARRARLTSKARLPTNSKASKPEARAKAQAAVLEKVHQTNFPTPPSTSAKGMHFTVVDDECICNAYAHVSIDSEKGANQTSNEFWEAVGSQSNVLFAENGRPHRTTDSLQIRFSKKISKAVLAFKPYHKDSVSIPQSGWDADMYEQYALELWKGDEGTEFQFLHCSRILKSVPKYDWEGEEATSDTEGTTATGPAMGGNIERPLGNKASKAAKATAKAEARASKGKAKGRRVPETISLDGTASMEQLLSDSRAMTENINNMTLRNALYLEFQMLMKMGKLQAADKIFKKMIDLVKPVYTVNGIPQTVAEAPLEVESDEDSSLEAPRASNNAKDDSKYKTDDDEEGDDEDSGGSDESSGGDARAARERAVKQSAKNHSKV